MLVRRLIEVGLLQDGVLIRNRRAVLEAGLAALGVAGQIVIRAVGNAFDLVELPASLPAPGRSDRASPSWPLRNEQAPRVSARIP